METTTPGYTGKTVKVLRELERDHARTIGYFEPITMILDHLAFSSKLPMAITIRFFGKARSHLH